MCRRLMGIRVIICLFIAIYAASAAIPLPQLMGQKWQITNVRPNISPYTYAQQNQNACDFTIFKAKDGTWQAIGCVRWTTHPSDRIFYRWEAKNITDPNWTEKGIFATRNEEGLRIDNPVNPYDRQLQAPHCFDYNGKYCMFYNNAGACALISDDGRNWSRYKNDAGSYTFYAVGRDINMFDNRKRDGKWYAYYCQSTMVCRTAAKLEGTYSGETTVRSQGNPESPFALYYNGYYYLWQQNTVYVSTSPMNFNNPVASTTMWQNGWAPEVIYDNGQWYVAYYNQGYWVEKMRWTQPSAQLAGPLTIARCQSPRLFPFAAAYDLRGAIVSPYEAPQSAPRIFIGRHFPAGTRYCQFGHGIIRQAAFRQ